MKVALANSLIGIIGSYLVGTRFLGLSETDILLCIFASVVAALVAMLLTLRILKAYPISKNPNFRLVRAWAILCTVYFGVLLVLAPPLRNAQALLYLIFPLILNSGFSILIFGPIQDYLVRAEQKKRQ